MVERLGERRNGRRDRIENGSRERIEKGEKRERDKRELRRQFEEERGGPKRNKETISLGQVTQGSHKYIS